jgi:predicted phage tail component-like protein
MDFTGFTFNGHHSLEFGIYRVSDGSRYQETLIPTFSDYTSDIQGKDGRFYWGSDKKEKNITINIAFDNVSELQLRKMRNWLATDKVSEIIFDELPYKYYTGKINGEPQISYVCFTEIRNKKECRVYKGEGSLNFVCYYPYARSVHKFLDAYYDYSNKEEWAESSGMLDSGINYDFLAKGQTDITYYNPGDMPTNWKISFKKTGTSGLNKTTFSLNNSNDNFSIGIYDKNNSESEIIGELEQELYEKEGIIEIDTEKRMITFINNDGTRIPALFLLKEGDFFKLPVTFEENNILTISPAIVPIDEKGTQLVYDYLYY